MSSEINQFIETKWLNNETNSKEPISDWEGTLLVNLNKINYDGKFSLNYFIQKSFYQNPLINYK